MEEWYEIWSDGSGEPPYILIVMPDLKQKFIINIYDPKEGSIIYQNGIYENIKLWLLEDEYTIVTGRMHPDDHGF